VQDHALGGDGRVLDPRGKVVLRGPIEECENYADQHAPAWRYKHAVVLLHSLAFTHKWLDPLATGLEQQGLSVANIAYPNLFQPVSAHAARVRRIVHQMARDGIETVSFAGHSLGGLVIRATLEEKLPLRLGQIVYYGTPNNGSRLGESLHRLRPYQAFFGPSGLDVLPHAASRLAIPDTGMLVIAGGTGGLGYNPLLKDDNDGIVTVPETELPNSQQLLLPCWHRFLPRSPRGLGSGIHFLATGRLP
jgi:hypothetical protein